MKRDSRDSYEQQRERPQQSQYRKPYDRKPYQQRSSKGLVMLKSTVFALLIVLVVLSGAFFLIKNKGGKGYLQNFAKKCEKASEIRIPAAIEKIEVKGEVITVLTKPSRSNSQEIVKIDADCGTELGRISVKISESSPVEKSERK